MTRLHSLLLAAALLCAGPTLANDGLKPTGRWTAPRSGAAATPPMGWNAWNAFRTEVDEAKVMGSAQALVDTGLASKGYRYVNLDDGWWLQRRTTDGRLVIRTDLFPSARMPAGETTSFKPFVNRLHSMGLKAGIYTDIGRNACSQAWDPRSPNLPVGSTREREVGLEGFVEQDIRLFFAEWGFDYIKVDACGVADYAPGAPLVAKNGYRPRDPLIVRTQPASDQSAALQSLYRDVAGAIARHSPDGDHVFSICTWGRGDVRTWGGQVGNLWRTSPDIHGTWQAMLRSFDSVATRALYARPGAWNDPDMLFIGAREFDNNHLTEARSHFTLWAMAAAPLLIGYDLRNAPKELLGIWGNTELIAVNQDPAGHQATIAHHDGDVQVLVKSLADGSKAVALFNRGSTPAKIKLSSEHLKFAADKPVALKDLWNDRNASGFTGSAAFELAAREAQVFKASGTPLRRGAVFLSEIPARLHVPYESPWPAIADGFETPSDAAGHPGGAQADFSPYRTQLTVAGRRYLYGIGVLANSRLEVRTDGEFQRFSVTVGVDDASSDRSTGVTFEIHGDGHLLARSPALRVGKRPVHFDVNVKDVKVVELVAIASSLHSPPAAVWANAMFNAK